jgi:Uncharacterized protein conserved in bacteria
MILPNFCRNCLGKWFATAAKERGVELTFRPGEGGGLWHAVLSSGKRSIKLKRLPEAARSFRSALVLTARILRAASPRLRRLFKTAALLSKAAALFEDRGASPTRLRRFAKAALF